MSKKILQERRARRTHYNIRKHAGNRPRLVVTRSNKQIYAQVIDDKNAVTLVSASTLDKDIKKQLKNGSSNIEASNIVGTEIAKRAIKANIKEIVFDRGPYIYHGRIKAIAESARKAGLVF